MKNSSLEAASFLANLQSTLEQEQGIPEQWRPYDMDSSRFRPYRPSRTLV